MKSELTLVEYKVILAKLIAIKSTSEKSSDIDDDIKDLEKYIEWLEFESASPKHKYHFLDIIRTFDGDEGYVLSVRFLQKNPPKYQYLVVFNNTGKYLKEENIKERIGRKEIGDE